MIPRPEGLAPNQGRDDKVRLPRQERPESVAPTAEHVLAFNDLLPPRYQLPLLALDARALRLGTSGRGTSR